MNPLLDFSLAEAAEGLREGFITSRELTEAYLERIAELDPEIKAYLTVTADLALEQADEADKLLKAGQTEGKPLLGVPLAIKDVLAVTGIQATAGSKILEGFVPPYTATSVQKLLDAGIVVLGKTNTDEYAMGSSTENSAYQTTHNPWNLEHVPGGSSGGSAAAVLARLAPAALGSDTGGSIRQPASYCGVTGLKVTYGRISRYGLIAYGSSLDTVGPLARNAEDAALLYGIMAGHDPLDATTADKAVPEVRIQRDTDLKELRIGIPKEYFIDGIQPEVAAHVSEAIIGMEFMGAEVKEISLPHTEYALPVYYILAPAEASANLARFDGVRYGHRAEQDDVIEMMMHSRGEGFGSEVKRRIMLGTYALSAGYYDAFYGQAQKVRTLIKQDFDEIFKEVDVIAAPIAPTTAFKIGQHSNDPLAMYLEDVFTLPANLAGVPGIAFPVGFDEQGLPIGMQLMGRHFEEDTLLRTAHAFQLVTDWHTRMPEF